jgi:hypothetical protein
MRVALTDECPGTIAGYEEVCKMYGVLLPVTGVAIGLYALVAVTCVIVGSLMRMRGKKTSR